MTRPVPLQLDQREIHKTMDLLRLAANALQEADRWNRKSIIEVADEITAFVLRVEKKILE